MMRYFDAGAEPRVALSWVALLRVMLGVMFLTTWLSNLIKGYYSAEGLQVFFIEVFPQSENPLSWYAAFINETILPIREVFAPFQLVTEFLIGAFLLAGLLTPLTSLAGGIFILNTFLATFGHDWPWSYAMILGILFVVFFTRAGRSLGMDGWLVERRGEPGFYLWR